MSSHSTRLVSLEQRTRPQMQTESQVNHKEKIPREKPQEKPALIQQHLHLRPPMSMTVRSSKSVTQPRLYCYSNHVSASRSRAEWPDLDPSVLTPCHPQRNWELVSSTHRHAQFPRTYGLYTLWGSCSLQSRAESQQNTRSFPVWGEVRSRCGGREKQWVRYRPGIKSQERSWGTSVRP